MTEFSDKLVGTKPDSIRRAFYELLHENDCTDWAKDVCARQTNALIAPVLTALEQRIRMLELLPQKGGGFAVQDRSDLLDKLSEENANLRHDLAGYEHRVHLDGKEIEELKVENAELKTTYDALMTQNRRLSQTCMDHSTRLHESEARCKKLTETLVEVRADLARAKDGKYVSPTPKPEYDVGKLAKLAYSKYRTKMMNESENPQMLTPYALCHWTDIKGWEAAVETALVALNVVPAPKPEPHETIHVNLENLAEAAYAAYKRHYAMIKGSPDNFTHYDDLTPWHQELWGKVAEAVLGAL